MDTTPVNVYASVIHAGKRPTGISTRSSCVQSSGILNVKMSTLICLPSAAQVANNAYAIGTTNVDVSKWAAETYGGLHVGQLSIIDCALFLGTTAGAIEQSGAGAGDSARVAFVWGLTPGSTKHYSIRACAQDGSHSTSTNPQAFTLSAAGSGDSAGPNPPTALSVSGITASTATINYTIAPPDSGTEFQGTVFDISLDGGTTWLMLWPGKTNTGLALTGLAPATSYQIRGRTYDGMGNVGSPSSAVSFTTSAGTADTTTPSKPTVDLGSAVAGKIPTTGTAAVAATVGGNTVGVNSNISPGVWIIDPNTASEEVITITSINGSNIATISGTFAFAHALGANIGSYQHTGWVSHPTAAGPAWGAPATGNVAYYEVIDADTSTVVGRSHPTANNTPVYTRTAGHLATV